MNVDKKIAGFGPLDFARDRLRASGFGCLVKICLLIADKCLVFTDNCYPIQLTVSTEAYQPSLAESFG